MAIETIYEDIILNRIAFGPHLIQRMWENGISIDQVLDTILTGFTISKGNIMVVVKDCKPGFIITAGR